MQLQRIIFEKPTKKQNNGNESRDGIKGKTKSTQTDNGQNR